MCTVRGCITLLLMELFVSGKLLRAWEKAVTSVSGFTGGKAFRKYVCQHFLKETFYLFIVSRWHLNLLLLSVAEGK